MKITKNALFKGKWELIGSLILLIVFMLPFLTFAKNHKNIYVDKSATGAEEGTAAHPYHTISEALKHAKDNTDVHVAKGVYTDNIEIPSGVRVFGSDADKVIIRSRSSKKVVVSMKDDTEINKVTIEKGKNGIWIKKNAEVSIIDCIVRKNDSDGIKIEGGKVDKDNKVSITDSEIKNNGQDGVFAGKRRIVLINNDIQGNNGDGIELAAGTSAWMEKNGIRDNDKSGVKLTLDGSNIWTKNNSIRDNDREGIEVNAFGGSGRIDINKSKIISNDKYGIARVQRTNFPQSIWNGFTIQPSTVIDQNVLGNVSRVLFVF